MVSALLAGGLRRRPAEEQGPHRERASRPDLDEGHSALWRTAYVVPVFLIIAMVELTYGAQTVQLVLYGEQPALGSAPKGTDTSQLQASVGC